MNKKELVKTVAKKLDITQKDTAEIVDATMQTIMETVASGEEIAYPGFGKFVCKAVGERERINPATKEKVLCKAHNIVKFKPSQAFKDKMLGM